MEMTDTQITALQNKLMDAGYQPDVAEALAERGITVEHAALLSKREVLDHFLEWNGIVGYAGTILSALRNIEGRGHN